MDRFYFDANASVPALPSVVQVMARAQREWWANPTSTHREGQAARQAIEQARRSIALSLEVPPSQLVFCGSATEALHLLIGGLDDSLKFMPTVANPGEHSACLNPLRVWPNVRWLPCDYSGVATVVQMAANNESGIISEMPQVAGAVRIKDCCQAWGKIAVDLSDCDAAVFSAHKMGGPRGAALLWMRPGLPWTPTMEGPQERRRRGGTEDTAAILGLSEAVNHLPARLEQNAALEALRDAMEAEVQTWSPDFEIIGKGQPRLPNTSSLLLRGHNGEAIHMALDLAGFAISTGSACHSGATKPSHAIMALGYSEAQARSVIRISMLPGTSDDSVHRLLEALKKIIQR
jgi:cysteine desulfurase